MAMTERGVPRLFELEAEGIDQPKPTAPPSDPSDSVEGSAAKRMTPAEPHNYVFHENSIAMVARSVSEGRSWIAQNRFPTHVSDDAAEKPGIFKMPGF